MAERWCSNYILVINNFIAYLSAYIKGLKVEFNFKDFNLLHISNKPITQIRWEKMISFSNP